MRYLTISAVEIARPRGGREAPLSCVFSCGGPQTMLQCALQLAEKQSNS